MCGGQLSAACLSYVQGQGMWGANGGQRPLAAPWPVTSILLAFTGWGGGGSGGCTTQVAVVSCCTADTRTPAGQSMRSPRACCSTTKTSDLEIALEVSHAAQEPCCMLQCQPALVRQRRELGHVWGPGHAVLLSGSARGTAAGSSGSCWWAHSSARVIAGGVSLSGVHSTGLRVIIRISR